MTSRQSARVYRRRRAVVLLVLLIIVVVAVVLLMRGCSGGSSRSRSQGVPSASASVAACATGQVRVEATTDSLNYAADQQPKLGFTLTNTGSTACTIDAGTDKQVFTITSGSTRVWVSSDCQSDAAPNFVILKAGQKLTSAALVWARDFSSQTTCSSATQVAAPGAYHLTVSVGGVAGANDIQFALN